MLGQVIVWLVDQCTKVAYSCWSVVVTEFRRMINDPSRPRDYEHDQLLEVAKIPMDLCQGCQPLGSPFSLATPPPPEPY